MSEALVAFVPGAVGGFCNVFVGHPIDLIKVRQQTGPSRLALQTVVSSPSTFGMLRHIFVKEGIPGLYRGVSAPLMAVTPAFAVSFWSFDLGRSAIRSYTSSQDLSIAQTALAGGFSGIPLAMVVGPSERIKCLMQVTQTRGFLDCATQVYREGGIRSVFRGTLSTVLRDVPGNATYFATYEFMRREMCALEKRTSPSVGSIMFSGGVAGVMNWIVALPFDVLKSRLQTAPPGTYKNLLDVFRQLMQQEGVTALYRGLAPALLRAFPSNAACILGVETVRGYFNGR